MLSDSPTPEQQATRDHALAEELAFFLEECSNLDVTECAELAEGFVRYAKAEEVL